MRIIALTAENIKKLKIVDITPDAHMQQVTGKNASGKSSVLDSIWWALAGERNIQGKPVRNGCDKARIKLNLGEILVERKFTASGSTISVMNTDGSEWKSPQKMLDALLGELTFDPLKFARSKPREQFDELRKISNLEIDIDALNAANEVDFKRRTDVNREAKAKRAQAEAYVIPADTPVAPLDESKLLDEIENAGKFNADIDRRRGNRERAAKDSENLRAQGKEKTEKVIAAVDAAKERIAALKRQILEIEEETIETVQRLNAEVDEQLAEAKSIDSQLAAAGPLPEPVSITGIRISLDSARSTNALIEKRKQRDAISAEAAKLEKESKLLTSEMADREKAIADAIKAVEMPIAGLGFGANHITYNGVPFDQASDGEQLRVSASIAMAGNPKLRIIRIQDGSLLDDDGIAMIADMAREKDYQVWMERVDKSGKIGIYMEEGEVKAVNAAVDGATV